MATPKEKLFSLFSLETEKELSALTEHSGLEHPLSFRTRRRSVVLANHLINPKGELKKENLTELVNLFQEEGFHVPYPGDGNGFFIDQKMFQFLLKLQKDPSLWNLIKKFDDPLVSPFAENLVRASLQLERHHSVERREVRVAALAAGLGYLRQNVGSCFATAPAIMIQAQDHEDFFGDLCSILKTGKLQRTIDGVEHSVPISPSTGSSGLKQKISQETQLLTPGLLQAFEQLGFFPKNHSLAMKCQRVLHLASYLISEGLTLENLLKTICQTHKKSDQEFLFALEAFKASSEDPLLKIWEYTLASFSEVKMEFSRWNLYTSLGLQAKDAGGIGPIIYQFFEKRLNETNQNIEKLHEDYLIAFDQVRGTEALISRASTEDQIRRLKAEHIGRVYHMQACLNERDAKQRLSKLYAELYPFITNQYDEKFKEYFQEIYDPDMHGVEEHPYEDSPAGFRLVYKHGRTNASLWTLVHNEKEFIESLLSFFRQTEYEIARAYPKKDILDDIHALTTDILLHLETKEFLESALARTKTAHFSLHGESFGKKPWAYISGGTLITLVKTYFRKEGDLVAEKRKVDSSLDLLVFLLDALKGLSAGITDPFLKNSEKKMLMQSPTHAFLLAPGYLPFSQGWQNNRFSYTWARDEWLAPNQRFWGNQIVSVEEQKFLFARFFKKFQVQDAKGFFPSGPQSLKEMGEQFKTFMAEKNPNPFFLDALNAFVYESLPLTSQENFLNTLLKVIPPAYREKAEEIVSPISEPFITTLELRKMAVKTVLEISGQSFFHENLEESIFNLFQKENLSPPKTLVFADTNWAHFSFAFVISPLTQELELWRTDRIGSQGFSMMSLWKSSFSTHSQHPWMVFTSPMQWGG